MEAQIKVSHSIGHDSVGSESNNTWMDKLLREVLYAFHEGIMEDFNLMLSRWVKAKYKRFKRKPVYLALKWLGGIAKREPMFYHWKLGIYLKNVKCY